MSEPVSIWEISNSNKLTILDFQNILYTLVELLQRDTIDALVGSGGGAKTSNFYGIIKALVDTGELKNIDQMFGASGGAINLCSIATGMSIEKFWKLISTTDFKALLGKSSNYIFKFFNKDGKPLYELLKKTIASNITEYFDRNQDIDKIGTQAMQRMASKKIDLQKSKDAWQAKNAEFQEKLHQFHKQLNSDPNSKLEGEYITTISTLIAEKLHIIEKNLKKIDIQNARLQEIIKNNYEDVKTVINKAQQGDPILFKDLYVLHLLDSTTFKDFAVTATRQDNGALQIFSNKTTQEVEIALAVLASSALAPLLEHVIIEINGKKYYYVDGGFIDNTPIDYFDHPIRIIAFAYSTDKDKTQYDAVNSMQKISSGNWLFNKLFSLSTGVKGYSLGEATKTLLEKLRASSAKIIVTDTVEVDTTSFDKAKDPKILKYINIISELVIERDLVNKGLVPATPLLYLREFFYELYKILNKTFSGSKLTEKYLDFASTDHWQDVGPDNVLKEFINSLIQDSNILGNDQLIDLTLAKLNEHATSDIIKEIVFELCKLDKDITPHTKWVDVRFIKEDFGSLKKNDEGISANTDEEDLTWMVMNHLEGPDLSPYAFSCAQEVVELEGGEDHSHDPIPEGVC